MNESSGNISPLPGQFPSSVTPSATQINGANVFLRPMASPLSLGFLGLFYATVSLGAEQVGWIPKGELPHIALGILVFTVPVQFLSSVIGFLCRDTVAATGLGIQSGVWATLGLNLLHSKPGTTSSGLAVMLVVGALAQLMPAIGAAPAKTLAAGVLFTTATRWAITGGYEATSSHLWQLAAGAAGLFLGVVALYASLSFELEDQRRKTLLPTFRHRAGAAAMAGSIGDQVREVGHEAGVRQHL